MPEGMSQHRKKVASSEIWRGTTVIWWKIGVPAGKGAMERRGGDLMEVGEMGWPIWGKMLVLPTWMARSIFWRSQRPSPRRVLVVHWVRRRKKRVAPDEK
jgi:hypothetical protein